MPFTPIISDSLGRRPTLFIGSLVMLAGVALQTAATSIGVFIGSRGISTSFLELISPPASRKPNFLLTLPVGFGLTFALNAAPLLITELAYPTQVGVLIFNYRSGTHVMVLRFSQRGKLTSMYNALWYIGSIVGTSSLPTWRQKSNWGLMRSAYF